MSDCLRTFRHRKIIPNARQGDRRRRPSLLSNENRGGNPQHIRNRGFGGPAVRAQDPITEAHALVGLTVWDTDYTAPSKAFGFYREALCSVYMPWMVRSGSPDDFRGRLEAMSINGGWIARNRCSPLVWVRTSSEIAHSDDERFYALYLLSGSLACEQNGRSRKASPGEIIIIDSAQPCYVETGPPYDAFSVSVPKVALRGIKNLEDRLANTLVRRGPSTAPLLDCLALLAAELTSAPHNQLRTLYEASCTLLPLAAGCFDKANREKASAPHNTALLRLIREFVSQNLSDPALSPQLVAKHFGISIRYVHKLFASIGTTFTMYVTARRLEDLSSDLLSPGRSRRSVAELAHHWGFCDLSVFNRAFRRRFGCSPTEYRKRHE